MNILIIDDSDIFIKTFKKVFRDRQVDSALTLEEGLQKIRDNDYDFILLDVLFPEGLGFKKIEQIRSISPLSKIILITGFDSNMLNDDCGELLDKKLITAIVKKDEGWDMQLRTILEGYSGK